MSDTRNRILDAAERLFSTRGFHATSIRMITAEAGANLAAINYHFGSKNALIRAVYARRLEQLNALCLQMLDACEVRAGSEPLPVEDIVRAFIAPVLRLPPEDPFRRLIGRMYSEPGDLARQIISEHMGEVARRFTLAILRALPDAANTDLHWGAFFTIGVLAHTVTASALLNLIPNDRCDPKNADSVTERMTTFVCAGLRSFVIREETPTSGLAG
jgi:AcrR family transcriptional regulator